MVKGWIEFSITSPELGGNSEHNDNVQIFFYLNYIAQLYIWFSTLKGVFVSSLNLQIHKKKIIKISFGEVKQLMGSAHLSSGINTFYPRGKEHGYPLASGTLSSGKWHIILCERKLIPSGKSTRGKW